MAIDKYGRRINPNYQSQPISSFTSSYRSSIRRSSNVWSRINDFITNIGDWFEDNEEALANNISIGFYLLAWIGLGIGVIGQWISSGFFSALLTAVIGGVIVYYAAAIGMFVFMYVLRAIFWISRFLFYSVYTLLIAIAIIAGICFYNQTDTPNFVKSSVSAPAVLRPNYYCTATTVLNVREQPNSNARIIGQLLRNEEVYVYSIDNVTNFAKIDFKGRIAYASADYLKPK